MNEYKYTVTPSEFAFRAHVHRNTVYRWIRHGNIRSKKVMITERHRFLIPMDEQPPALKPGPIPNTRRDKWLKDQLRQADRELEDVPQLPSPFEGGGDPC